MKSGKGWPSFGTSLYSSSRYHCGLKSGIPPRNKEVLEVAP